MSVGYEEEQNTLGIPLFSSSTVTVEKDNEANSITLKAKENYSEYEEEIGTWIDGKPIYRKVFIGNMTNTVDQWVNLQKCNLDHPQDIIKIEGTIKNTKSDKRVLSINAYETSSYKIAFSYLGNTDYLQCYVTGWTYTTFGFKYIVIIEYTKTTN